jgi:histidyl-tRNA synthetase
LLGDDNTERGGVVLVHDAPTAGVLPDSGLSLETLARIKAQAISAGHRVRLEKRSKNLTPILDRASAAGFMHFASVDAQSTDFASLTLKSLG